MSILLIISIICACIGIWQRCRLMAIFSAALVKKAMRRPSPKQRQQLEELVKDAELHQGEIEADPQYMVIATNPNSIIRAKAQEIYDAALARGFQRVGEVGMIDLFLEMGKKLSVKDVRGMVDEAQKARKGKKKP